MGWKVGATNQSPQQLLGLPGPFRGRLLRRSSHGGGAHVTLAVGRWALVEAEILRSTWAPTSPSEQAPFALEALLSTR